MLDLIALALRLGLVAVFAVAAFAKLRTPEGTAEALQDFGVPPRLLPLARIALPAAELLASVLLLVPATHVLGAYWSLLLLVAFTTAIATNLARGRRPDCRCFGETSTRPIGYETVLRNVALAAMVGIVVAAAPSHLGEVRSWLSGLDRDGRTLVYALGMLSLVVVGQGFLLSATRRDIAELKKRAGDEATADVWIGLPADSEAPDFTLPTVEGGSAGLSTLLQNERPVMLVFIDPSCGPCEELIPDMVMWQKSLQNAFTLGLLSRGEMEANRYKAEESGLTGIMVQRRDEVGEMYRSSGTPSAVVINADGTVGSQIVHGVDAIRRLFDEATSRHAHQLWRAATGEDVPRPQVGLAKGTGVPDVKVKDFEDREWQVGELVRRSTLMLFWSPRCGYCHQIKEDLRMIERSLTSDRQLLFATAGTLEENRAMGLHSTMMIDEDFTAGQAFGANGTPSAVWIENGRIKSSLAVGTEQVKDLAQRFSEDKTASRVR